MFFVRRDGDSWETTTYHSRLRAWQREDVIRILTLAGLQAIHWHMPEESGFYQPIVTATVT